VQHRGADGELHLYSSKPPLLATILAGEYWLVHQATGWTLGENPYEVGRLILFSPWLFHNSGPGFGDRPENARLVHLQFFARVG